LNLLCNLQWVCRSSASLFFSRTKIVQYSLKKESADANNTRLSQLAHTFSSQLAVSCLCSTHLFLSIIFSLVLISSFEGILMWMIKWERLQFLFCLKARNCRECLGNNI
jgi:hypothetical protein